MIDYKTFIEDNFLIKNKKGELVPFRLNGTQDYYWNLIREEYPTMEGIRENILKFRQPGFSSLIDGIFTVDFIMAELGEIPLIDADIYSHKNSETETLFNRVSLFLDSFLDCKGANPLLPEKFPRKSFLEYDNTGETIGKKGAAINVKTASAKVSGRGGTKQNIHWSEVAFYQNTEIMDASKLVMGAEQQVADGIGKIFRESTGNMVGDFFNEEYELGKKPGQPFRSRFLGWWLHREYSLLAPPGWKLPDEYLKILTGGATVDQCYWHWYKVHTAKDPDLMRREYPIDDIEAFMQAGTGYFDIESLRVYKNILKSDPIRTGTLKSL